MKVTGISARKQSLNALYAASQLVCLVCITWTEWIPEAATRKSVCTLGFQHLASLI